MNKRKDNDLLMPQRHKDWSCDKGCQDPDMWRCAIRPEGRPVAHCGCKCHQRVIPNED